MLTSTGHETSLTLSGPTGWDSQPCFSGSDCSGTGYEDVPSFFTPYATNIVLSLGLPNTVIYPLTIQ